MNKAKLFAKIGRKTTDLQEDRRVTQIRHSKFFELYKGGGVIYE
jgi:hypothetical protein